MRPHFLQKKTESPAASSRTAYPSPPAKAEVSLTPSLVLPPHSPTALRGPACPLTLMSEEMVQGLTQSKWDIALHPFFPNSGTRICYPVHAYLVGSSILVPPSFEGHRPAALAPRATAKRRQLRRSRASQGFLWGVTPFLF